MQTGSAKPGESQTYAGSASNFYGEIPNVTGMFYKGGRLYYTLAGQSSLYWRRFTPDTGTVGADRFTYMTSMFFAGAGGVFYADDKLYVVRQSNGNLEKMAWPSDPSSPQFSATVSGPGVDGVDWRGAAVFVGP